MNEYNMNYDVIGGTGWGALNARILTSYEKGREKEGIDQLIKFWKE